MYLIINNSKQELVLGDLRLSLVPGQKQDIDMICSRYVAEQSKSLKTAISRNLVKIIRKDSINPPPLTVKETHTIIEKDSSKEIMEEMRSIKKELIERQQAMARKQLAAMREAKGGLDPETQARLNEAIQVLQGLTGGIVPGFVQEQHEEEFSMSDEKAVDIHKRTIDRITKGSKSNIKHSETTSKTTADNNVDELEDLLG